MPAWLIWTFVALLSWGVWAVLSRALGDSLTAEQSQGLSTLGLLPVLLPLARSARKGLAPGSPSGLWLAFAGGVASCLGNVPYYAAVARGDRFASVVSLTALAPLVTVVLAVVFLGERLNRLQSVGLLLAGAALWLFNVSDTTGFLSRTVVVALAPIALWGLSGFLQKAATLRTAAEPAALVYLGAFVPLGVFYVLREPWPHGLAWQGWVIVVGLGFFLGFGNYAVLAAYAHRGKAVVIAPLVNLYPVISISVALLFGERIALRELAGILCALASVAALSMESPAPRGLTPGPPAQQSPR